MSGFPYTIEQVVPHQRPMILLDEIIDCGSDRLEALVTIRPTLPFFGPKGVPVHVAIEFMAQACGAFVGVEGLRSERPPRIGLLLGTRDFSAPRKWLRDGERLRVTVNVIFREDEMGMFDCQVFDEEKGDTLASARLTVYQPPEGSEFEAVDG